MLSASAGVRQKFARTHLTGAAGFAAFGVDPWAAHLTPRLRGGVNGPLGVPPQTPEVFLPRRKCQAVPIT